MNKNNSNRGREKFSHDGHLFCFDKFSKDGQMKFWRCDMRYLNDCPARVHTSIAAVFIKLVGRHTHGSDPARIEADKLRTTIRRRAEQTLETPSVIISSVLNGVSF